MSRLARALAVAAAILAPLAATASAHQGDPRYRSVLRGIDPETSGLRVEVVNYDDSFELTNRTGRDVTVLGYDGEPYARLSADGAVAVNRRSPARYLNDERYGDVAVPAAVRAHPRAAPDWELIDRTGRFAWHDHRMHWMSHGLPPQVTDQHRRAKVFDYAVPIRVGDERAAITGTLWWVGESDGAGAPLVAAVTLALLAVGAVIAVVVVRRRRARPPEREREAW
jgi:hypothetical protein